MENIRNLNDLERRSISIFIRKLNIYWVDARIILIPESRIHDILEHGSE